MNMTITEPKARRSTNISIEVPSGYKRTEVGVIPEDWDTSTLGAVTTEIGDGIHATPIYSQHGEYFFINGNNIRDGHIVITEDTKTVTVSEFRKYKKDLGDKTVLLSINGTIGNLALFAGEAVVLGKSAAYLNVKGDVDRKYFYYSLHSQLVARQFNDGLTGTTIRNLGLATIRSTQIPVPPTKAEQRAIASALSDVDRLIVGLEKLIAKKRAIKQSTMQQLLTGKTHLPGFSGEWGNVRLRDLLSYERPDQYIVRDTEYSERGDVPVLTANKSFILGYTAEDFGICRDLPAIVFDDFTTDSKYVAVPFKVKSSAIKLLRSKHDRVDLRFVFDRMKLIQFPLGDHKRYYISEYQNLELVVPEYEEQQAIATVLSDMDAEIAALERQRDKTKQIKQGMMQQLLTGRVRLVNSPEREV